jgi:hypothetical protein
MAKTAIDAEVNNQIFRTDWTNVIAIKRELAAIGPVRLQYDSAGYLGGQCLARVTSTGIFGKWSAVSGLSTDSPCVLLENILAYSEGTQGVDALSGGALARAIFAGFVYQSALLDFTGASQLGGKTQTDATGIAIVKF